MPARSCTDCSEEPSPIAGTAIGVVGPSGGWRSCTVLIVCEQHQGEGTREEKKIYIRHRQTSIIAVGGKEEMKGMKAIFVLLTPVRQSRYSASSVSRAWIVCWCEMFFRALLRGLSVLLLPRESFFFATAATTAAGFLLERFFVVVLVISVRVDWKGLFRSSARTSGAEIFKGNFRHAVLYSIKTRQPSLQKLLENESL